MNSRLYTILVTGILVLSASTAGLGDDGEQGDDRVILLETGLALDEVVPSLEAVEESAPEPMIHTHETLLEEIPVTISSVIAAKFLTTLTHELGHMDEAIDQGLDTEISMPLLFGGGDYAAPGAVGSFQFEGRPRNRDRITLAGIGTNLSLYHDLSEDIVVGGNDNRFSNAVALFTGLELARYVVWDAMAGNEASDLVEFRENTGTSDEFIYAAALMNVVDFCLSGGTYHARRTVGLDAERPTSTGLFGTGLRPSSWIDEDKICIGVQFTSSF
jgi:hypothetical protein